jgi:hypothetical protein
MTTINKIVQDHKSKMKRGTPQLNMCDPAVMVSAVVYSVLCDTHNAWVHVRFLKTKKKCTRAKPD